MSWAQSETDFYLILLQVLRVRFCSQCPTEPLLSLQSPAIFWAEVIGRTNYPPESVLVSLRGRELVLGGRYHQFEFFDRVPTLHYGTAMEAYRLEVGACVCRSG